MVKIIGTKQLLDDEVKASNGKLLVIDFFATWCGPCKAIGPKFEEMSKEFKDVVFVKVDVDENEDAARHYEVSAMPTFIFVKNGKEVAKVVGASEQEIRGKIEELK